MWLPWPRVIHHRSHRGLVIACDSKRVVAPRVKLMATLTSGDQRFCTTFLASYLQGHSKNCKGAEKMITINFATRVFRGFVALTLKKLSPITVHSSVRLPDYHRQHARL